MYEANINICCLYSKSAYCKAISSIYFFNKLLKSHRSFDLNSRPCVPFFWYGLYWSHDNDIIFLILLNQSRKRLWKRESRKSQISKEVSILIKLNIHKVFADLYKHLSTYHCSSGCNCWNYFASFEFDFMMSNLINGVVFSSEIREKCNEIYVSIVVVILLKLNLFYILNWVLLNLLWDLIEQINKSLFVFLSWAVLVLFALIQQVLFFCLLLYNFSSLNF